MPVSTQYTDGITGALVVHPTAQNPTTLPTYDSEIVIQVKDKPCNGALVMSADWRVDGRSLP